MCIPWMWDRCRSAHLTLCTHRWGTARQRTELEVLSKNCLLEPQLRKQPNLKIILNWVKVDVAVVTYQDAEKGHSYSSRCNHDCCVITSPNLSSPPSFSSLLRPRTSTFSFRHLPAKFHLWRKLTANGSRENYCNLRLLRSLGCINSLWVKKNFVSWHNFHLWSSQKKNIVCIKRLHRKTDR